MTKTYTFKTKVWLYPGIAGWHFMTLPKKIAENIDFFFSTHKRGWGSLPVSVSIGETKWKTSIFPDKQSGSYLLPLKKEVRQKEAIKDGDVVSLSLEIVS